MTEYTVYRTLHTTQNKHYFQLYMEHLPALTTCRVVKGILINFKEFQFYRVRRLIDYSDIKLELNNNRKVTRKFLYV